MAENPYKIPKFGGKTNYIQKIGGDIISRNSGFLAVQNSSIGDLAPLVGPTKLTIKLFTTLPSDPRDL